MTKNHFAWKPFWNALYRRPDTRLKLFVYNTTGFYVILYIYIYCAMFFKLKFQSLGHVIKIIEYTVSILEFSDQLDRTWPRHTLPLCCDCYWLLNFCRLLSFSGFFVSVLRQFFEEKIFVVFFVFNTKRLRGYRRVLFERGCAFAATFAKPEHRIGHAPEQLEPGPR